MIQPVFYIYLNINYVSVLYALGKNIFVKLLSKPSSLLSFQNSRMW